MREGLHMFRHSTTSASFLSVLIAAIIFLLFPARGPCGAQGEGTTAHRNNALKKTPSGASNPAMGVKPLLSTPTGSLNPATGADALSSNTDSQFNTAIGYVALSDNTEGDENTAIGVTALN